jgi:GTP cyclohydrolase I
MCDYKDLLKRRGAWGEDTHATPDRARRALADMTNGYDVSIQDLFVLFDSNTEMPVTVANIEFTSVCEHHMLPFIGTATVTYSPNGKVIGLSKIARLVEALSNRFQIQERLTQQIADAMFVGTRCHGCTVVMDAMHTCMCCRGVKKTATTRTVANAGDDFAMRLSMALSVHGK